MTYEEVKAEGARTIGTLSYIPRDGWNEISIDQLRQMKADLSNSLTVAHTAEERKDATRRDRYLSTALEKAVRGERIFGVTWDDDGFEYLFASTHHAG